MKTSLRKKENAWSFLIVIHNEMINTGAGNERSSACRKNRQRDLSHPFPPDFMFELTKQELEDWRCQFGTSNGTKMGLRYLPRVFTEQGVAMLSTVLRSRRAISVNIQIMRAFTQLREMLSTHEDLRRKIEDLESKYDQQFTVVFEAIKQLLTTEIRPKRKIGFEAKEPKTPYGRKACS